MDRSELERIVREAIDVEIRITAFQIQSDQSVIASAMRSGKPLAIRIHGTATGWHVESRPMTCLVPDFSEASARDTADIYSAQMEVVGGPLIGRWVSVIGDLLRSPSINSLEEFRDRLNRLWPDLQQSELMSALGKAQDAAALAGAYESQADVEQIDES
jgi:hypothetical protein